MNGGVRVSPLGRHILLTGGASASAVGVADAANSWKHCTGSSLVYVTISELKASGGTISTFPDAAALVPVGGWILSGGKLAGAYSGVHVGRGVAEDSEFSPVIEPVTTNRPGRFASGTVNFVADSNPSGVNFDIATPEGTPGAAGFRILVNTKGSLVVGSYAFNLMRVTAVFAQAYEVDEYSFGLNVENC